MEGRNCGFLSFLREVNSMMFAMFHTAEAPQHDSERKTMICAKQPDYKYIAEIIWP